MSNMFKQGFIAVALAFSAVSCTTSQPTVATSQPTVATGQPTVANNEPVDRWLRDLNPAFPEKRIVKALDKVEGLDPKSPRAVKAIPLLKVLLRDSRETVRRKAARILGKFHADLDESDLKAICEQLKANDPMEAQSALKALRDLNVPSTVPDILPCLKDENPGVVRDACRTLAVIGNKDVIPFIEPLLNSPNDAVKEDAEKAIAALKAKP
jgi:HEAT repeat protein